MRRCKNCVVGLLSACRPDYCYGERQGLIEEAAYLAAQGGHVLGPFDKVAGHPVWRAHCVHCGQSAAIALDPGPGEPQVHGDATSTVCPQA